MRERERKGASRVLSIPRCHLERKRKERRKTLMCERKEERERRDRKGAKH